MEQIANINPWIIITIAFLFFEAMTSGHVFVLYFVPASFITWIIVVAFPGLAYEYQLAIFMILGAAGFMLLRPRLRFGHDKKDRPLEISDLTDDETIIKKSKEYEDINKDDTK